MSPNRLVVIIGSGPGIGSTTAAHFAANGFDQVALVSRNEKRLQSEAEAVSKSASNSSTQVKIYPTDIADSNALQSSLANVEKELGNPEVVLFNAARVAESSLNEPWENVLEDCKVMQVALYLTAAWALPRFTGAHPSFLLSGGSIWKHPSPYHISLSMQKGAQVNLLTNLSQLAGPKGIHVSRVDIGGPVSDDEPERNAANIAKVLYELSQQEKDKWETVRPIGEE